MVHVHTGSVTRCVPRGRGHCLCTECVTCSYASEIILVQEPEGIHGVRVCRFTQRQGAVRVYGSTGRGQKGRTFRQPLRVRPYTLDAPLSPERTLISRMHHCRRNTHTHTHTHTPRASGRGRRTSRPGSATTHTPHTHTHARAHSHTEPDACSAQQAPRGPRQ